MVKKTRIEQHSLSIQAPPPLTLAALLVFAASIAVNGAAAQAVERTGMQVVDAVCVSCHGSGAHGAPKIGDKKAWSKRASQGLTSLTEHALKGIREMPAHGGNMKLTDLEIGRAIAYMVNQSGGKWVEPASAKDMAAERTGEQVVKAQCAKCHQEGVGGAPKIGDRDGWRPRLTQGIDNLVRSAIRGHGGMPARGGMADLTDPEIRAAVTYMFNPGGARAKGPPAPAATRDSNSKVIEGTEIRLGIVSAESLRAQHPKPDAESSMHGGIPKGKRYYHVNVSLRDSETKAEIKDAQVEARVANPLTGETKKLEPMLINRAVSYGNYFRMPGDDLYTITLQILRPGARQAIEARFNFKRQ